MEVKILICIEKLLWSKTGLQEKIDVPFFVLRVTVYLFEANKNGRKKYRCGVLWLPCTEVTLVKHSSTFRVVIMLIDDMGAATVKVHF